MVACSWLRRASQAATSCFEFVKSLGARYIRHLGTRAPLVSTKRQNVMAMMQPVTDGT